MAKRSAAVHRRGDLKMGRYRLQAYLSTEEKDAVRDAAKLAGMSMSTFARYVVVRQAREFLQRETAAGPPRRDQPAKLDLFLQLQGAGKHVFEALGGGEAFLKAERAGWSRDEE